MNKAVMVTTKEGAKTLLDELGDQLVKEEVFIKIVSDDAFNLMFNKTENVEIELSDEMFNALAIEAHNRDITFNQLCNEIIREELEKKNED